MPSKVRAVIIEPSENRKRAQTNEVLPFDLQLPFPEVRRRIRYVGPFDKVLTIMDYTMKGIKKEIPQQELLEKLNKISIGEPDKQLLNDYFWYSLKKTEAQLRSEKAWQALDEVTTLENITDDLLRSNKKLGKSKAEVKRLVSLAFQEMKMVTRLRVKTAHHLNKRHPAQKCSPDSLYSLPEEIKAEGRKFLRRELGGSLQGPQLLKEVFRKPRQSTRRDYDAADYGTITR